MKKNFNLQIENNFILFLKKEHKIAPSFLSFSKKQKKQCPGLIIDKKADKIQIDIVHTKISETEVEKNIIKSWQAPIISFSKTLAKKPLPKAFLSKEERLKMLKFNINRKINPYKPFAEWAVVATMFILAFMLILLPTY